MKKFFVVLFTIVLLFAGCDLDIQDGSKTDGFSQEELDDLISKAQNVLAEVKPSADGSDVSQQEYWVTSDAWNALNDAITRAQNSSVSIDSRYSDLYRALNAFPAKQPGTCTFEYNFGELAAKMKFDIPPDGITLNDLCKSITNDNTMDYAKVLASGSLSASLYKDKELTQPFIGSDKLTASTKIFSSKNNLESELSGLVEPPLPIIAITDASIDPEAVLEDTELTLTVVFPYEDEDNPVVAYRWYVNDVDSNSGGRQMVGATLKDCAPPTDRVQTLWYYVEIYFEDGRGYRTPPFKVTVIPSP